MGIACIARSMARRPHNAPAYRHLLLPRLIITLGCSITAMYSRPPLSLDYHFATHRDTSRRWPFHAWRARLISRTCRHSPSRDGRNSRLVSGSAYKLRPRRRNLCSIGFIRNHLKCLHRTASASVCVLWIIDPVGNSPQQFTGFLRTEYEKYGKVIRVNDLRRTSARVGVRRRGRYDTLEHHDTNYLLPSAFRSFLCPRLCADLPRASSQNARGVPCRRQHRYRWKDHRAGVHRVDGTIVHCR